MSLNRETDMISPTCGDDRLSLIAPHESLAVNSILSMHSRRAAAAAVASFKAELFSGAIARRPTVFYTRTQQMASHFVYARLWTLPW